MSDAAPPSAVEGKYRVVPHPKLTSFMLHNGKRVVLEITSDGDVIADSIEDASEAGKVFVTAIRQQLAAMFGVRPSKGEHIAEGCGDD